jgi:hypothetical protein
MSARLLWTLFALGALVMLAAALWLPLDLGQAAPATAGKPGADLAVLPGDCALFITFRPADVLKDPLAKAFAEQSGMLRGMGRGMAAPLDSIERMTAANVGGEMATIVRTSKPYDKTKLLATLQPSYRFYGFKEKDKGEEPEKPRLIEKKVNGRTIHFYSNPEGGRYSYGDPLRYTQAVGVVDANIYVTGTVPAVEALLGSTVKQTTELAHQIDLAGKHTIVAGFQGKAIRAALRADKRRYDEMRKRWSTPKDAAPREDPAKEEKKKEVKDDDSVELSSPEMIVIKPFAVMKSAVLTGDVGKTYRVHGRITYATAEAADDGETAIKMTLYFFRELAVMGTKVEGGMKPLAPVVEQLEKVLKGTKITRTGNVLETSISLTLKDGVIEKVRDEMEAQRKREEERMKEFRKDKAPRFLDKEKR